MINYKIPQLPKLIKYGYELEYIALIISKFGPTLEDLFQSQKKHFSKKITAIIIFQILEIIESFHQKNIILNDIKPEVFGLDEEKSKLFLLDFGFSDILMHKSKKIIGINLIYDSINSLKKLETSKKDDLECLIYMFLRFIKGYLPWENIKLKNKEKYKNKIIEMKEKIDFRNFYGFLSEEVESFVNYVKNLKKDEEIDYNYLKNLLNVIINEDENNSEKSCYYTEICKYHNLEITANTTEITNYKYFISFSIQNEWKKIKNTEEENQKNEEKNEKDKNNNEDDKEMKNEGNEKPKQDSQ